MEVQKGGHLEDVEASWDMEDRVFHDIMDVLCRPHGSEPESFV